MKVYNITNSYINNNYKNYCKPAFTSSQNDTFVKSSQDRFGLKAITSKTAQKMYNMDYTPKSMPIEGYFLTYVLNKKTENPVDIYVKQISSQFLSNNPSLKEEKYCFYRENPKGGLSEVGTLCINLDTKNKKIAPGYMDAIMAKGLSGVGLREQHMKVETMLENGYSNIDIISVQDAYDFHSKCGFQSDDYLIIRSEDEIKKYVDYWCKRLKTDENTVRKMLVFNIENEIPYFNINKTRENLAICLNKAGLKQEFRDDTNILMHLSDAARDEWILLAQSQPILLKKSAMYS